MRIPGLAAKDVGISEGSALRLSVEHGALILKPKRDLTERYSLAELVAGITAENLHEETDWGGPIGSESW